ncbi:hypothetical protein BDN70DRAFT_938714 [Pholiota conissans]|uniref:Uncharacterized protein n=1 Tax=Pholiota conissans TaxID=109636 RepID=A0A9P5YKY4_9AGAR|nr:hypothetical protein BDN70DRAFT_938714 [Pholiota conissans]
MSVVLRTWDRSCPCHWRSPWRRKTAAGSTGSLASALYIGGAPPLLAALAGGAFALVASSRTRRRGSLGGYNTTRTREGRTGARAPHVEVDGHNVQRATLSVWRRFALYMVAEIAPREAGHDWEHPQYVPCTYMARTGSWKWCDRSREEVDAASAWRRWNNWGDMSRECGAAGVVRRTWWVSRSRVSPSLLQPVIHLRA